MTEVKYNKHVTNKSKTTALTSLTNEFYVNKAEYCWCSQLAPDCLYKCTLFLIF